MKAIIFINKIISLINLFLISSLLVLTSGCTAPKAITNSGKVSALPSKNPNAYFYIGGFGGGYHVKIENNVIQYADTNNRKKLIWKSKKITTSEIYNLEKAFIRYGVTDWNQKYINPFIQDGTKWGINYKLSSPARS